MEWFGKCPSVYVNATRTIVVTIRRILIACISDQNEKLFSSNFLQLWTLDLDLDYELWIRDMGYGLWTMGYGL